MSDDIEGLINPDQLRLVMVVVAARSFSGAAAALGVSQPSISQQVKRLERLSGCTLFRRSQQGIALTTDGEALVVYGRAILGLTDDLRRQFRHNRGTVHLTLGMSEDFYRTALPSVMRLFLLDHSNVEMRIVIGLADTLTRAIDGKAVDLAVMRREPDFPDGEALWTDDLVWLGRQGRMGRVADPVPLVVPIAPNFLRNTLTGALQAAGRTWRVAMESFGVAALESGVQAGLGLCATPRGMPRFGTAMLGADSGLPALPQVSYVMRAPDGETPDPISAFIGLRGDPEAMRRLALHDCARNMTARPNAGGVRHVARASLRSARPSGRDRGLGGVPRSCQRQRGSLARRLRPSAAPGTRQGNERNGGEEAARCSQSASSALAAHRHWARWAAKISLRARDRWSSIGSFSDSETFDQGRK